MLINIFVDISLTNYTNCTDGELRLAGGTELSGRVEICYNRVWYGICSDNYDRYNAPRIICKGLGHSSQGTFIANWLDYQSYLKQIKKKTFNS